MLTAVLVILVILAFLRTWRATFIPALALPLSIIGTFAGMAMLDFSLDNVSLLALTLALGFVVDDAIVVLENIVRYVEQGMKPFDAAIRGANEIGFTVLSITLSLVAVFIPILFMGGIVGRFFFEFAMTISIAILLSGFVSLTLTPMLCSRLLKAHHGEEKKPRLLSRAFERRLRSDGAGLPRHARCLARVPWLMWLVTLGTIVATVVRLRRRQEGLPADRGHQHHHRAHGGGARHRLPGHARPAAHRRRAHPRRSRRALHQLQRRPELLQSHAQPRLDLRAAEGARPSARARAASPTCRPGCAAAWPAFPASAPFPVPLQNLRIGSRSGAALYQYTLTSVNQTELYDNAQRLIDRVKQAPGFTDVTSDLTLGARQLTLNIDRDALARYGLTMDVVRSTLYSAFGTRKIATVYTPSNDYAVLILRRTRRSSSIRPCSPRSTCARARASRCR